MDTKVVEQVKNILITTTLDNKTSGSFTADIYVEFIPDLVKVHAISYASNNDNGERGLAYLTSNLVSNRTIGTFQDYMYSTPETSFILRKPVNGTFTFNYQSVGAVNRAGDIGINLQFFKYKELKEGKIY